MRVKIHKFLDTVNLEIVDTKQLNSKARTIIYNQLELYSKNKKANLGTE